MVFGLENDPKHHPIDDPRLNQKLIGTNEGKLV